MWDVFEIHLEIFTNIFEKNCIIWFWLKYTEELCKSENIISNKNLLWTHEFKGKDINFLEKRFFERKKFYAMLQCLVQNTNLQKGLK